MLKIVSYKNEHKNVHVQLFVKAFHLMFARKKNCKSRNQYYFQIKQNSGEMKKLNKEQTNNEYEVIE